MKLKKTYDIMVSGYLCIDLVIDFKKDYTYRSIYDCLKPGKLTEIEGLAFMLGGIVANTGMAVKKFGKDIYLNGLVGDDHLGEIILDQLNEFPPSAGIKKTAVQGSAFGIVIAPPGVDRIFLESPGCSVLFGIDDIDFEAIAQSRIFHFGYVPLLEQFFENGGSQLAALLSRTKKLGTIASMDLSLPDAKSKSGKINWLRLMEAVLPFTDILIPSLEELLYMMMPDEYERISAAHGEEDIINHVSVETIRQLGELVLASGVKILLIKMAHRGIYLKTGDVTSLNDHGALNLSLPLWNNGEWLSEAYAADEELIANASGAGDTAAAAFLVALLQDETPQRAIKFAAMAGRNSLYCKNLYLELPEWPAMAAAINEQALIIERLEPKIINQFTN